MDQNEDVFPLKHGDIPASYVGLPEGIPDVSSCSFLVVLRAELWRRYLGKKAKAQVMWALVDGLYGFLGWPEVVHMSSEKRAGIWFSFFFWGGGGGNYVTSPRL